MFSRSSIDPARSRLSALYPLSLPSFCHNTHSVQLTWGVKCFAHGTCTLEGNLSSGYQLRCNFNKIFLMKNKVPFLLRRKLEEARRHTYFACARNFSMSNQYFSSRSLLSKNMQMCSARTRNLRNKSTFSLISLLYFPNLSSTAAIKRNA